MAPDRDSIEAAEHNYVASWRALVQLAPGCVVEETDDLLLTHVPTAPAYFNNAFVKPPADPLACVRAVKAFFAARQTAFTIRFRSSAAADADALAVAADFAPGGLSPLMNAEVDGIAPGPKTDIRRADAATWSDHLRVVTAGFGLPAGLAARLFGPWLVGSEDYVAFNACIDDEVVSTAALVVTDTVAGVYNVATSEAFRTRGLGEATTRAAVQEARRRGCHITTLQASAMAYPMYERMGFRTVGTWRSLVGSQMAR